MTKRLLLGVVVAATLAIAVAYASAFGRGGAPTWAAWLLAIGVPLLLAAMAALGAARPGRGVGRLALPIAAVWAIMTGGFVLALVLPPESAAAPALFLGLPRRAAVIVYGVGLLPLFILPLAYALTFDNQTLSEEDLRRVRAAAAAATSEAPGPSEERAAPAARPGKTADASARALREAGR